VSYVAILAGFAVIIALLVIMAGAAWYFVKQPTTPPGPPQVDTGRIAKTLAREAEARLSQPPLDDRGTLINSGKRKDSTGDVYYIIWAGYSDTGLVLAEKAVEDVWRQVSGEIRVGILYPEHPRDGERVLMVAGVSEKPLVELSLKLDENPKTPNSENQPIKPIKKPAQRQKERSAKIAIIIDDIGNSVQAVDSLLAIPVPITLSVLPNADYTFEVCQRLKSARAEVMLHIPMEPQSYPENDPGDGALLVGMSPGEIRKNLKDALKSVPLAVGMNNHMGSAFTTDIKAMRALMKVVKERDLYFIDSRTHHRTVAFITAQEAGVPSAERRVFLDHSQDPEYIRSQLELLAETANNEGVAIGIGHPYPETLQILARELPGMSEQGYRFVFASEAVR